MDSIESGGKKITGNEVWLPVVGYESLYEVSDLGNVKSKDKLIMYPQGRSELRKGRIMRIVVNSRNGYCYVGLTKNHKQKGKRVHILVAMAHIPNPNNLPEVNHEDFDKENNSKCNLKWCDRYYQNQHSAKKEGRKWQNHRLGKSGFENPASKPVMVFTLDNKEVGFYESGSLAAKDTNSNQTKVSACCIGKRKSHNNLKFQFA